MLTGFLLDQPSTEMLEVVTAALWWACRAEVGCRRDQVGFLAGYQHYAIGYTLGSSVGFGYSRPAGTLQSYFDSSQSINLSKRMKCFTAHRRKIRRNGAWGLNYHI